MCHLCPRVLSEASKRRPGGPKRHATGVIVGRWHVEGLRGQTGAESRRGSAHQERREEAANGPGPQGGMGGHERIDEHAAQASEAKVAACMRYP